MDTRLLNAQFDYFRFLAAAERQKAYLIILDSLYHERLAHQIAELCDEFREFRELIHKVSYTDEASREKLRNYFDAHRQSLVREGDSLPEFLDYRKCLSEVKPVLQSKSGLQLLTIHVAFHYFQ